MHFLRLPPFKHVRCFDIYHMDSATSTSAWLEEAFCDPVIQDITVDGLLET